MRKTLLASLAVTLLLVGFLLSLLLPRHCPVNWVACKRIEVGMTQAEVEAILGGPPGDYRTRQGKARMGVGAIEMYTGRAVGPYWKSHRKEWWLGDEGDIKVGYDLDPIGKEVVVFADFWKSDTYEPGLIERIQWRIEEFRYKLR